MKPIAFFAHHQGRGHANRIRAIVEHFDPARSLTVMTAAPEQFDEARNIEIVALPDMIGAPSRTTALHQVATPEVLHCVPLGVAEMRSHMALIVATLERLDPALFVVDVSAEIALLARIMSVPSVTIRMHGMRGDAAHLAGYQACVGILAPFDEQLEQADYPDWAHERTFYSGGLCTIRDAVLPKNEARKKLDLDPDRTINLVIAGGGGSGTPYAPLTVAARAAPDDLWIVVGPVHREGHETEFANLVELGWISNVTEYLAAADRVISSAGDNVVHEIARVHKPFLCFPEWRYFDEQRLKAQQLARLGAAVVRDTWPGNLAEWRGLLTEVDALDTARLAALHDEQAAQRTARWLEDMAERLWEE